MSGAVLFRYALRRVVRLQLPQVAERDLVAVLEAGRVGSLQLFYDACVEVALEPAKLETRGAAVTLCYCAGQLADDLADGDCAYLEDPRRTGPGVQFMLQNLFHATLIEAELPGKLVQEVALELVQGAGPQQLEVRTRHFDLESSRLVAEGISGRQFAAYLRVLWSGTRLDAWSGSIGRDLGFAAHVAADARTQDRRFTDLGRLDRCALIALATEAADRVRARKLRCMEAPLRDIDAVLEAAA